MHAMRPPADTAAAPTIRRHSLSDDIYEVLLAELIALRIPPGERLSVDALSRKYGLSQTPIRAALIRLESEGLVVKKFNAGYNAAPMPSGSRFQEVYAFRLLIEPEAAALASQRIDADALQELRALCDAMDQLTQQDAQANYGKFAMLDGQFHQRIVRLSGNQIFSDSLERLFAHMHLFRLRYHATVAEEAVKEHIAILDALERQDADAARHAMATHIRHSRDRMQPFFVNLPDTDAESA
jgi:DNA-binding GntR family transcriptional regulator